MSKSSSSSTTVTKSPQANSPTPNDKNGPNSSSSMINAQPINNEPISPASARTYPCLRCPMVFSTPMAMGGHQNAHKAERAAEKRRAQTPDANPFSVTAPNPGIDWSQAKRPRREEYAFPSYPPASGALASLRPFPSYPLPRPAPQYFSLRPGPPYPSFSTPLALSAPASLNFRPGVSLQGPATMGSNRFFGVPDFFGPAVAPAARSDEGLSRHSVAPTAPPDEGSSRHPAAAAAPLGGGASSSPAIGEDREKEVEEENDIDLDLKL